MDYVARTPQQLGQVLRACRARRELSQSVVAEHVGIKQDTVSALETRTHASSIESLYKVLSALGLELVLRDPPVSADDKEW